MKENHRFSVNLSEDSLHLLYPSALPDDVQAVQQSLFMTLRGIIMNQTTTLMILDGFGYNEKAEGNAIAAAHTPNLDRLFQSYPCTILGASGESVGLPDGQMGNSEVGHLNIGAGRIVYQELTRITKAIREKTFFENPVLLEAVSRAKANDGALHIFGLLSDGGVHSHIDHLKAVIGLAAAEKLSRVYIHCFLDGRDVPPRCAEKYIAELEEYMTEKGVGKIATVSGRYYAMDRDKRWERVQKAYDAITAGIGELAFSGAEAVRKAYRRGENDEFVLPTVIAYEPADADTSDTSSQSAEVQTDGCPVSPSPQPQNSGVNGSVVVQGSPDSPSSQPKDSGCSTAACHEADDEIDISILHAHTVQSGDSIIMFNFRPDRAREITRAFTDTEFDGFERAVHPENIYYVCMTQYDASIEDAHIAFPPEHPTNTLGEYLASVGKKQLRLAETEKYAHVTFFFNGGVEEPNRNEDRILIPSPKVATYDLQPEMSAPEVKDAALKNLRSGKYDAVIINFANPDMVGHTGIFDAAVKAVETIDVCVGEIAEEIIRSGGNLFITADHGNADLMLDEEGNAVTAHSTNPVPAVLITPQGADIRLRSGGILADIAPTLLDLMQIPQPKEMTGKTLIRK